MCRVSAAWEVPQGTSLSRGYRHARHPCSESAQIFLRAALSAGPLCGLWDGFRYVQPHRNSNEQRHRTRGEMTDVGILLLPNAGSPPRIALTRHFLQTDLGEVVGPGMQTDGREGFMARGGAINLSFHFNSLVLSLIKNQPHRSRIGRAYIKSRYQST